MQAIARAHAGDAAGAHASVAALQRDLQRSKKTVALTGHVVAAELARRTGNHVTYMKELQQAVDVLAGMGGEVPPLYYYPPRLQLAQMYASMGQKDRARALYRAELHASPNSPSAQAGLAELDASK